MTQHAKPSELSRQVEMIVLSDDTAGLKQQLADVMNANDISLTSWVGQLHVTGELDDCCYLVQKYQTTYYMPMVFVSLNHTSLEQVHSVVRKLSVIQEHGLVIWLNDQPDTAQAFAFADQLDNAQHVMLMSTPATALQWRQLMIAMAKMQRSINQQQWTTRLLADEDHDQKLIKQLAQANVNAACIMAELEEARDLAMAADQAKGNFLANITHELRTPLSAIMGFAEILREDLTHHPEHVQFLQCIYDNGQNLLEILDSILLLTLLDSDELVVETQIANPAAILQKVYLQHKQEAQQQGLAFNLHDTPRDIPTDMVLDVKWVEQILNRLVHNAIKFTPKGQIDMSMNWHQSQAGYQLHFVIRDTGIGIKPQIMQSIFEPFHQADNSASRRYGGIGLGLAISRKLAHCLGGDIHVSSVPDQGSFFELILNVADPRDTKTTACIHDDVLRP